MSPIPLIPRVSFLLVPGAKPPIKDEPLFADVVLGFAAEAFPGVMVEGFKYLLRRKRLVGPSEGRIVAPVSSELFWADACPIRVDKLGNCNHTQPDADPVNLAEFVVAHPFLLVHSAESLHEGLAVCTMRQRAPCVFNLNVGIEVAEALSDMWEPARLM